MNLPLRIRQEVEKWASLQGISFDEFILQAVSEKINVLNQPVDQATVQNSQVIDSSTSQQLRIYRKEGILVVDAELP